MSSSPVSNDGQEHLRLRVFLLGLVKDIIRLREAVEVKRLAISITLGDVILGFLLFGLAETVIFISEFSEGTV